jgi:hypothetical protein
LDRLVAASMTQPMRRAHLLMRPPPTAQLLQNPGLASHWHAASPLPICPQPKRAASRERQIKQLDAKLFTSFEIGNNDAVVRFDSLAHSFTLRASRLFLGYQSSPLERRMLPPIWPNRTTPRKIEIARARQNILGYACNYV